MKLKFLKNIISIVAFLFVVIGCNENELIVDNPYQPSSAINSASDAVSLSESLYGIFYNTNSNIGSYDSPGLAFLTMADAGTCSWGNWGMRDLSSEPRIDFNNDPSYSNAGINSNYWKGLYSIITKSNEILKSLNKYTFTNEQKSKAKALALFNRGLAFGYLGLVYDKAYAIKENTNLASNSDMLATLSDYKTMITYSLSDLDEVINICNSNNFVASESTIPGNVIDQNFLKKLANSYAARIYILSPRNTSENSALNWNKILNYSNNGITADFMINVQDATSWDDQLKVYSTYPGWGRVDMRIINMLDSSQPKVWPDAGYSSMPNNGVAVSPDNRLNTDFQFLSSNSFNPTRGKYHFSSYRYSRWDDTLLTFLSTITPEFWKAENDLIKAEALLRTTNINAAVTIVNSGTRITRGHLTPTNPTNVEKDIIYERTIELFNSSFGIDFFDMRRRGQLQKGTFLHLPVPGDQLQLILESVYSFGGAKGKPGSDVSDGGWK